MYLCKKLLDQTIINLNLVMLNDDEEISLLDDTIIFTLIDSREIQLFLNVGNRIFLSELSTIPDTIYLPFVLESNECIIIKRLITHELDVTLPLTIVSITEVYASYDENFFLIAVILWSSDYKNSLSICVETDEIELLTQNQLNERLTRLFSLKIRLRYHWYDT